MNLEDVLPAFRAGQKIGIKGVPGDYKLVTTRDIYGRPVKVIQVYCRDEMGVYRAVYPCDGFSCDGVMADWEVRE